MSANTLLKVELTFLRPNGDLKNFSASNKYFYELKKFQSQTVSREMLHKTL